MADIPPPRSDTRFHHDVFIVDQPFTLFVNRYFVHAPADDGFTPGELLVFCRQKPFALKEDLRLFADEEMTHELVRIKARRRVDIGGRYLVTTPDGAVIGALQRRAKESLLRTTWAILGADGQELAVVRESSVPVAVFRRVQNLLQAIPLIGGVVALLLDLIPIPYHFDITHGDTPIGRHSRKTGIRDRYRLEINDPGRRIDRRLVVALGVGLDALQSR
jgi:hypothetical protein